MKYNGSNLKEVLSAHKKWIYDEGGGERAYLRGADLRGADLRGADLQGAYLQGADLQGADLQGADLQGAKNVPFISMACPDSGAFIGWKKCKNDLIVKLLIPGDARRSSATGRKCRCDKATVLAIETPDGAAADTDTAASQRDTKFLYKVGKTITVDDFDENRFNECAPDIHFFINRQEAVDYE